MLRVHLKPPSDYILACPSRATLSHGYQNDTRHKKYTNNTSCHVMAAGTLPAVQAGEPRLPVLQGLQHVCHCD